MADVKEDIAAYEAMQAELEAKHPGDWVLVHDRVVIGTYPTFNKAAQDAVARFGRGPYLIRQIGAPPVRLPASVMYHAVG